MLIIVYQIMVITYNIVIWNTNFYIYFFPTAYLNLTFPHLQSLCTIVHLIFVRGLQEAEGL